MGNLIPSACFHTGGLGRGPSWRGAGESGWVLHLLNAGETQVTSTLGCMCIHPGPELWAEEAERWQPDREEANDDFEDSFWSLKLYYELVMLESVF